MIPGENEPILLIRCHYFPRCGVKWDVIFRNSAGDGRLTTLRMDIHQIKTAGNQAIADLGVAYVGRDGRFQMDREIAVDPGVDVTMVIYKSRDCFLPAFSEQSYILESKVNANMIAKIAVLVIASNIWINRLTGPRSTVYSPIGPGRIWPQYVR